MGCKEKIATEEKKAEMAKATAWMWVAIDSDSKLVISWFVGSRTDGDQSRDFI